MITANLFGEQVVFHLSKRRPKWAPPGCRGYLESRITGMAIWIDTSQPTKVVKATLLHEVGHIIGTAIQSRVWPINELDSESWADLFADSMTSLTAVVSQIGKGKP